MVRAAFRCSLLLGGGCWLIGCGGEGSSGSAPQQEASLCATPVPFPWSAWDGHAQTALTTVAPEPTRGDGTGALHTVGEAGSEWVSINTHMHNLPFDAIWIGVRFWGHTASAQPQPILFSLSTITDGGPGYGADLEAGQPWPVQPVELSGDWEPVTVFFADLAPEGPGEPRAADALGSMIHFLIPPGSEYDLWLDDIDFLCDDASCASSCAVSP